ncbi:uroporphyrinogen-III C-methyltransferase [Corynebacterium suicordis]|uniref:uroporphyrinogen-III C-methyltransferase n=1 Tax=Corynebacterium suicordis DSM 45110 TaxID=1121369 RepID=A0ABR9ZJ06_9CORY|nr:uroporphyrinogen-III C-methyltransferase [Corynebacterium suicordis]MBF4553426.1 uroporphyrinogen-III C-methyltransferase [Corynebacterium suicordis DSM 45110]MDR6277599.1 uroporphyrin-III C-methyltransferase [Corynebacterium suicordis]
MSLHLSGLTVFVPSTASAEICARRIAESGALPVVGEISSFLSDAKLESPYSLAMIPADLDAADAERVVQRARELRIPVDDRRSVGTRQTPTSSDNELGTVTLVGGGPGDPELITVAGARAIAEADVILADHLGPFELAETAAEESGAEVIDVSKLPYGKQVAQEQTNQLLIECAQAGKNVVRLKGGDPFVFGRGFEEWEALHAAGIPVRVIPGVTSATSAPAVAGLSLTHRGVNHDFTVVSGHVPPGDSRSETNWDAVARLTGTLVLIMAVKNAPAIATTLMKVEGGKSTETPVSIIENASMPSQRLLTTTLGQLAAVLRTEAVKPPALFVIGEVADKHMQLG